VSNWKLSVENDRISVMKERITKMTVIEKMERIAKIEKLAKDKYGDNYIYALWGSAQSFLTDEKQLEIMERVMSK
jgi:hypothetical protein